MANKIKKKKKKFLIITSTNFLQSYKSTLGKASLGDAIKYVEDYLRRMYRGPWANRPVAEKHHLIEFKTSDESCSKGHYGMMSNWICRCVEDSVWWDNLNLTSQTEILENEIPKYYYSL